MEHATHVLGEPLDSGELATFVAAVDTGSLTAAADALELTQSAASKRILALERRLGVRLLERGRFGATATEAGRVLYPEAQLALDALRHAAAVVAAHTRHAPSLRLAASHTIGGFLLPGWITRFRAGAAQPPRTQVQIVNSQAVLASVRAGEVDVGFIESLHPTEGLEALTILSDEIVAVVAPGHRWARRRAVPARALPGEPYLARELGSGTRAVATDALHAVGISLEPTLETASTQSLKRAVLDGGFTLISRLAIEAELRAGTLCAVRVADVDLTRPLRSVRRRRPAAAPDAQRFWRYLRQTAAPPAPVTSTG
ncbi:MAG TPA: LysR family transcriptional regulator [Solirubrobacteraceae bacterium]|nr:LysR family transcriptional regulator [Solirubrobacteraceae bacterium]